MEAMPGHGTHKRKQRSSRQGRWKSGWGQLTYPQAHGDPAHQEHLLGGGQTQDHAADAEDEAGDEDADAASQPAVEEAPAQGGDGGGPDGAGHQQLLPQVVQVHLLLQGQHRSGHHPGVIAEEEPPQGGEEGQHVDEAGGDGATPGRRLLRWGPEEVLLPIFGSPEAQKVPHRLQAEFMGAAGHRGSRIKGSQEGAASAQHSGVLNTWPGVTEPAGRHWQIRSRHISYSNPDVGRSLICGSSFSSWLI